MAVTNPNPKTPTRQVAQRFGTRNFELTCEVQDVANILNAFAKVTCHYYQHFNANTLGVKPLLIRFCQGHRPLDADTFIGSCNNIHFIFMAALEPLSSFCTRNS